MRLYTGACILMSTQEATKKFKTYELLWSVAGVAAFR